MRNHIEWKKNQLAKDLSYLNDQVKSEFLKYEIWKSFSKTLANKVKSKQAEFKKKIRALENYLALTDNFEQYSRYKNVLEAIFEKIAEGVKFHTKYIWYDMSIAWQKVFLNLAKKRP